MKCPYRIDTTTEISDRGKKIKEKQAFSDCLMKDCPFYGAETQWYGQSCKKAAKESANHISLEVD
jgi:hypothetical protein